MGKFETGDFTTNCVGYFVIILSALFFVGFIATFVMTGIVSNPDSSSSSSSTNNENSVGTFVDGTWDDWNPRPGQPDYQTVNEPATQARRMRRKKLRLQPSKPTHAPVIVVENEPHEYEYESEEEQQQQQEMAVVVTEKPTRRPMPVTISEYYEDDDGDNYHHQRDHQRDHRPSVRRFHKSAHGFRRNFFQLNPDAF